MDQLKCDALLGFMVVCLLLGIGGVGGYYLGNGVQKADSITLFRVKDVGTIDGEPMDSTRLDSLYQEWIEKPLQKWIEEH